MASELDGLTGEHLDALSAAVAASSGPDRRRLQDVLLWATTRYTAARMAEAVDTMHSLREPPLELPDLQAVETLMRKGMQHNGVIPELRAGEVTRSVAVVTELLQRAQAAVFTQEDQEVLTWVFDAAAQDSDRRPFVRGVERKARRGLGLTERPVWTPDPKGWLA